MGRRLARSLTAQVLLATALGIGFGALFPDWARHGRVVSDIFIRLVKMVIAPIVFTTVTMGLSGMGSLRQVGTLGARAIFYFEAVSSLALGMGVVCALVLKPGAGVDLAATDEQTARAVAVAAQGGHPGGYDTLLLHAVPDSAVGALAGSDMLPILVFAAFFGLALARTPNGGESVRATLDKWAQVFFEVIALVMQLSPAAAFAAMAYAIAEYGVNSLWALGQLLFAVYFAMVLFLALVLAPICRWYGFRLTKLIGHIWQQVALVFGTSSSESALPGLMTKLEAAGCQRSVVHLVVPTGYSFNLDGTSIYLSMSVLFVAQAYQVPLGSKELLSILFVLMLTSKGAAGVTGSGFVTLAATLNALPGQPIPVEGLVLLMGIDRFMSAARALTNLIGNSVATVVLAKSQGLYEERHLLGP